MIRNLLLVMAFAGTAIVGNAQICTPDMGVPDYGIYPDSATGFDTAWVGQAYNQTVTAYVPPDTCVVIIIPPCSVLSMDSIVITNFTGLPPNFTYGCNPTGCAFVGGAYGCVEIYSTVDPVIADTGRYNLTIDVEAYVGGFGLPNPFTIDYYYIDVLEPVSGILGATQTLAGVTSSPNPFNNTTQISYNLLVGGNVEFRVMDLLGELVYVEQLAGSPGNNTFDFNRNGLSEGIYIFSLSSGQSVETQKLVISE